MKLDYTALVTALPEVAWYGTACVITGAWTVDSRQVQQGDVFVAVQGASVDGHDFLGDALQRGARVCVVAQARYAALEESLRIFFDRCMFVVVPDPVQAIIRLARWWRNQFTYPVIGVTGSVGKTTTKELIAEMFRQDGRAVVMSRGNQNTQIGVALTLLRLSDEVQGAVVELGISKRGEMARLAELARPTIAVITAIGHSHLEGLGSLADIAAEKRQICTYLPENGVAIINGDQLLLTTGAYAHPTIRFGSKLANQVQARSIKMRDNTLHFTLKMYGIRRHVQLATVQQTRVFNGLAAAAAAFYCGISADAIVRGLEKEVVVPGRFQQHLIGSARHLVIDDSYNANPESMKAAISTFEQIGVPGKKIAVLGDMLELGVNSDFWHRQIGRFLRKAPSITHIVFVGERMRAAQRTLAAGRSCELQPDWVGAAQAVQKLLAQDREACILVKASRGIGLNKLVARLQTEVD